MKRAEIILGLLSLLAIFMSVFLIPGGSFLIILSLSAFSMMYFYLGFAFFNAIPLSKIFKKESYKDISSLRIVGAIVAGISLSTLLMGILFTAQKWPGAYVISVMGLFYLTIAGVAALIKGMTNKSAFYNRILRRVVVYGAFGFLLFYWSDNIFYDFKYRNYPDYIEAVKKWRAEPENYELREKLREEREKMELEMYRNE